MNESQLTVRVALFRDPNGTYQSVKPQELEPYTDDVRISEYINVSFPPRASESVRLAKREALVKEEQKLQERLESVRSELIKVTQ